MKGDSVANERVTLDELKKKMADFAKERDWDQFHSPRNLLLALVCPIFLAFLYLFPFFELLTTSFLFFSIRSTLIDSNIHLPPPFLSEENIVMVALFGRVGPYSVFSWILPSVLPSTLS